VTSPGSSFVPMSKIRTSTLLLVLARRRLDATPLEVGR
jgi:hypothetical protein